MQRASVPVRTRVDVRPTVTRIRRGQRSAAPSHRRRTARIDSRWARGLWSLGWSCLNTASSASARKQESSEPALKTASLEGSARASSGISSSSATEGILPIGVESGSSDRGEVCGSILAVGSSGGPRRREGLSYSAWPSGDIMVGRPRSRPSSTAPCASPSSRCENMWLSPRKSACASGSGPTRGLSVTRSTVLICARVRFGETPAQSAALRALASVRAPCTTPP